MTRFPSVLDAIPPVLPSRRRLIQFALTSAVGLLFGCGDDSQQAGSPSDVSKTELGLKLVNQIWAQTDFPFEEDFLLILATSYGATFCLASRLASGSTF